MSAIDDAIDKLVADKNDAIAKMEWWKKEAERWRNQALDLDADEQCRLLGMSAERECDLRGKLERERALADRLAGVLELYFTDDAIAHHAGIADAIAAWKEARSE